MANLWERVVMKNLRLGLAMVELIVAITIIGITMMAAPAIISQISHSAYDATKSEQVEETYKKLSLQRAMHIKGTLSALPSIKDFGHQSITYHPLKASDGEMIRLIEYNESTIENNTTIVMRAFGVSTSINRVPR